MISAEQEVQQIHTSLLTSISDTMVETDKEYENFISHMCVYVKPGLIMQHKTTLGKLKALEKKKLLGPGNYKILKEICINSGNNILTDDIETAEKEIMKVRKEYGEGALSGSKQLKSVDESLDTDDDTEEESTHVHTSDLHTEQRYQDSTPRKRPISDLSDLAPSGSKHARNEYETQRAEGRCYDTNKDVSTTIEHFDVQAQQRKRESVPRKRRSSGSRLLDTFNSTSKKHQYNNWVYAGLGFKYILHVLLPFCNDIVNKQHRVILNNVKRKHNIKNIECGECILWNLQPDHVRTKRTHCPFGQSRCNCMFPRGKIPCRNYVCGAIYDEIIKLHTPQTPGPYWENTDIQKWCTDPWSIAKCFISHASKSISDTDISGILQLIGNNIEFHNHITEMNRITKLRQWRNTVAHSSTMELDDKQLDILLEDITTLLENEQELKTRQETEDVMKILQALKENPFEINTKAETEAVSDALLYTRQSIEDICERMEDLQEYLTNRTATNEDRSYFEQPYASRRFESLETRVRQLEREMESLKQAERKLSTNAEAILDKKLPSELETDPFTRQLYNKALQNDSTEDTSIKVMVIGCYKHGKTSLVRRLLGQKLDDRESTNEIEVHRCIAKPNGEWEELKTEKSESKFFRQLSKQTQGMVPPESEDHERTPDDILPNQETITKARKNKFVHDHDREQSLSSSDASATKQSENIFQKFKNEFQMSFDTKSNLNDFIDLRILDLSGKFTYYATHQILLSTRAVYVLVINLKDDLNEILTYTDNPGETHTKSLREYISFWINSIHTFVGTEDGYFPPIILVGTHKDEIDIDDSKVFSEIRKLFKNNSALNHLQMKTFSVSNTDTELSKADFISLRSLIIEVGKQQPMKEIPRKWMLLENRLKIISKHKKIIDLSELCKIASEIDMQIERGNEQEDIDQLKLFLTFQNERGTFCYFSNGNLSEYVVIDPIFLIDAFKSLITSGENLKARFPINQMWQELCDTAKLHPNLLKEVWSGDFLKFHDLLLEFLQGHHIIANVQKYDEHNSANVQSAGYYIAPSFLKSSVRSNKMKAFLKGKNTSNVSLKYGRISQKVLPVLFNRILAAMVGKWPISNLDEIPLIFDNFVACEPQRDHAVLLILVENGIELLTVSFLKKAVSSEICDAFRRFVEKIMKEEIYKLRFKNVQQNTELFSASVRCRHSFHKHSGSKCICALHEIKNSDTAIPCPDKRNHEIRHEYISQWFPDTKITMPTCIQTRRLNAKEYSKLAVKFGRNWQHFANTLGIHKEVVEQIEIDNFSEQFRIYQLFLKWDEKEGENATFGKLVQTVLQTPGLLVDFDEIKNFMDDL